MQLLQFLYFAKEKKGNYFPLEALRKLKLTMLVDVLPSSGHSPSYSNIFFYERVFEQNKKRQQQQSHSIDFKLFPQKKRTFISLTATTSNSALYLII